MQQEPHDLPQEKRLDDFVVAIARFDVADVRLDLDQPVVGGVEIAGLGIAPS
ncbi:MAG: hypothetical protein R2855_13525 [Thermomicrobiales bacterium]